ncbi:methyltransferase domain-containing protein [Sphingobium sp. AN641]|uniref:class I SAM-dependent methyltransferase n=1 Tax=Sphingobium sp. AN641 TaxID=3133443 RepID=UPI0030C25D3F
MASIPLREARRKANPLVRGRQFLKQWTLFARQFAKHPGMIGSIIPSSSMLVDSMLAGVDWERTRLLVEYGPGVGTFTRPILDHMHPDATLLAIDLNVDFITYLREEVRDPRLRAVHGSAVDVRRLIAETGHAQADYILSGLPFSTLPAGVGDRICAETEAMLRPGGAFLVYQYSAYVRRLLLPAFGHVEAGVEWKNIPPCRIFRAFKREAIAQAA